MRRPSQLTRDVDLISIDLILAFRRRCRSIIKPTFIMIHHGYRVNNGYQNFTVWLCLLCLGLVILINYCVT